MTSTLPPSEASATVSLTIPTVTEVTSLSVCCEQHSLLQDDLFQYYSTHFGQEAERHVDEPDLGHFQHASNPTDEDDGLGYYADGVKRTLTDEQVAMFRHSEIQSLLRERRLKQEKEAEEEEEDEEEGAYEKEVQGQRTEDVFKDEAASDERDGDLDDDEEEYEDFLAREKELFAVSAGRKVSHDGIMPGEAKQLDYDDGPTPPATTRDEQSTPLHHDVRKRVFYGDVDVQAEVAQSADSLRPSLAQIRQEKVFFWPQIGG